MSKKRKTTNFKKEGYEVMLDLETLSTRPNASIVVIAAIKFRKNEKIHNFDKIRGKNKFYLRIDTKSCTKIGLHIDPKTVEWWKTQDKNIQKEVFGGKRISIKKALKKFSEWFGDCENIWSQGATFDIPILAETYRRCKMDVPWKYYNARDTRTIYDIADLKVWDLPNDNLHHALYDCWRQIWGVKTSIIRLNL